MSLHAMLWASNLEIPSSRKLVLMIMGDHANTKNECWPSRAKLARRCSLSVGTIDRCIEDAETWGLIEKELRQHESGKKRSNKYTLRLDRAAPPDAMDGSMVEPAPGDDEENDDESMACDGENAERPHDESIPRGHGEAMGRSHSEAMDGITVEPANRTSHLEPSPLIPPQQSAERPSRGNSPPPEAATLPAESASASRGASSVNASGEAQGSAGQEKSVPDRNSFEFIRMQFEGLITEGWQQTSLITFAGDSEKAFKVFREWPFELREEARVKARNYLFGKKAEFAAWNGKPARERAKQPPKPPTVQQYLALKLFSFIGMPSAPPPQPKPPSAAWCAELLRMPLTQFDLGEKHFVAHGTEAWGVWAAAFKRAGLRTGWDARKVRGGTDDGKVGRYFRQPLPPHEEDFTEQPDEQRKTG